VLCGEHLAVARTPGIDEAINDPSAKIAFDNLGLTDHHRADEPGADYVLPGA